MIQTAPVEKYRIRSIDLLRGIVMVIMALDHTRDFLHIDAVTQDPLDLSTTNPFLFFTRFVTHYCAPTFVFLSGISAYLSGKIKSRAEHGIFLIKRGLWLIVVEILIISLAFSFDPLYHFILMQVIWAIGISMVILGLLIRLPSRVLLALGLMICFGHNILDFFEKTGTGNGNVFYTMLHRADVIPLGENRVMFMAYPFLPWTGLMLAGYGFGRIFDKRYESGRKRLLLLTGTVLLLLFVVLRLMNVYGDPNHWTKQATPVFTLLSFLNVAKYPPSLLYMCITLGPSILFLALVEKANGTVTRFFSLYGRVPFFYYVLHFYLIHLVCVIVFFASGFGTRDIVNANIPFLFRPPTLGFSLPIVYVFWAGIVLLLYFPCRWFDQYKKTHRQWWLRYV